MQIGRGVVKRGGKDVALVAYGTMVNNALAAAEMLAKSGVTATVADMRSASAHPVPLRNSQLTKSNVRVRMLGGPSARLHEQS